MSHAARKKGVDSSCLRERLVRPASHHRPEEEPKEKPKELSPTYVQTEHGESDKHLNHGPSPFGGERVGSSTSPRTAVQAYKTKAREG